MGPSKQKMDSPYAINMRRLLLNTVKSVKERGHDIGFHPGYATLRNYVEFKKQKVLLESILGQNLLTGRQHVIRYEAATTPWIWNSAGMTEDYSLFYPDRIGFRNGACHHYYAFDLINRKRLKLKQTSTSIADFSLLDHRYSDLSYDEAMNHCLDIIKQVKKFKGKLVILFHTGHTNRAIWKFYKSLMDNACN